MHFSMMVGQNNWDNSVSLNYFTPLSRQSQQKISSGEITTLGDTRCNVILPYYSSSTESTFNMMGVKKHLDNWTPAASERKRDRLFTLTAIAFKEVCLLLGAKMHFAAAPTQSRTFMLSLLHWYSC